MHHICCSKIKFIEMGGKEQIINEILNIFTSYHIGEADLKIAENEETGGRVYHE